MTPVRYLVRGGTVVPGGGHPPVEADVLFDANGILEVGQLRGSEAEIIEAAGKVVVPGFIDTHVHAEGALLEHGYVWGALAQGVTTMILGQDGCGLAPGEGESYRFMSEYFRSVMGDSARLPDDELSVAQLRELYDRHTVCNVAYLVPQGLLRARAIGVSDSVASEAQLLQMRQWLETALEEGAIGVSSGFDYVPSRFASHEELVALLAPLRAGGIYASHMAGYGPRVRQGLEGLVRVGKDVLIPVHASHLWGPADDVAAGLDDAINGGVSISWDMYPYTAGSSLLAMVALPPSWQTESISRSVERLGRPTAHAELETLTMSTLPHLTVLMYIRGEKYRHLEGLSLTDAAARCGMDLWRFIAEILIDSRMGVAVIFHRPELHESDVWSVIERSGYTAGSDGVYLGSYPHPRSYATFTTVLARCLETDPVGGWSVAVDRLSTSAAERFQLGGRGRIVVGAPADIAVFQPDKVRVNASWEDPACPSSGLVDAFVSGVPVVIGGELTANRPGRALRL